jgi:hypothetical protein
VTPIFCDSYIAMCWKIASSGISILAYLHRGVYTHLWKIRTPSTLKIAFYGHRERGTFLPACLSRPSLLNVSSGISSTISRCAKSSSASTFYSEYRCIWRIETTAIQRCKERICDRSLHWDSGGRMRCAIKRTFTDGWVSKSPYCREPQFLTLWWKMSPCPIGSFPGERRYRK